MKYGSTALYQYLVQHPSVLKNTKKGIHFFDNNFHRGISWYRHHFPIKPLMKGRITGEASPYYIFYPYVPRRLKDTIQDIRLIAILRYPVNRAYSHYQHSKRNGFEHLSFKDAIKKESMRIGESEELLIDEYSSNTSHQAHSYLSRGIYWQQIESYYKYFNRSRILILKSEDLLFHLQSTMDRVTEFLDLVPHQLQDTSPVNKAKYKRKQTETYKWLKEIYRPHNARLYELIGEDFG